MKYWIWLLISLFCTLSIVAQDIENPSSWIDYSKTYYKIKVAEDGLFRITGSALSNAGVVSAGDDYKMYFKGEEIPIHVTNSGSFSGDDYIEFFGEKNDGEFDTQLYVHPYHQPSPEKNLFSDTSVYFLTVDPASENLRFETIDDPIVSPPVKELFFFYDSYKLLDETFSSGKPVRLGGNNNNLADFEEGEGFASLTIFEDDDRSYIVKTPSPYTNAGNAVLSTRFIGKSNDFSVINDHHIETRINGALAIDTLYEGYESLDVIKSISITELSSGEVDVNFACPTDISDPNKNSVAYINIKYPRNFDMGNGRSLLFEIDNDSDKYLEFTNFNGGGAPILYDLTNGKRFIPEVVGSGNTAVYKIFMEQIDGATLKRSMFLSNTTLNSAPYNMVKYLDNFTPTNFVDYSLSSNQGKYLIITNDYLRQGPIDQVERYANYRSSMQGGEYDVLVVEINQLYDQFAWGNAKHPLSIRNFVNFAFENWDEEPEYLLLLGKGVSYNDSYKTAEKYFYNLIPTYGQKPSDAMLSAPNIFIYKSQLATGRIPAVESDQIRAYLDKLVEYETDKSLLPCLPEDRLWMKNAMHISGGNNLSQSNDFLEYLNGYKAIFEDSIYAGQVISTYNSLSEDVIDEGALIDEFINNGLSILTFFGHAAGETFSVDINDPEDYENYGKLPFIMAGSCLVGDIFNYTKDENGDLITVIAEDYVLADSLGSIGFLASASLGFPVYLDEYLEDFYTNFCLENYNEPIGKSKNETISTLFSTYFNDEPGIKITAQEYTLTGDPAVVINSWDNSELYLDETSLFLDVAQISADMDSFALNIVVQNLGRGGMDSITVNVKRELADGTVIENAVSERFILPGLMDTLTVYVPMLDDSEANAGLNIFTIDVDYDNEIVEDCEDNNQIVKEIFILSDLLLPIAPCNFSIVNESPVVLYASTGQPILDSKPYVFQVDTTEKFNSPLFVEGTVESGGGVVEWNVPTIFQNGRVYYWRTSSVPLDGGEYSWRNSSFLYDEGKGLGWHQSHYYQYTKDTYTSLLLDSISRDFSYESAEYNLFIDNDYDDPSFASIQLGDQLINEGTCLFSSCSEGLVFSVYKSGLDFEPLMSVRDPESGTSCNARGTFGNIHCTANDKAAIEFSTQPSNTEQLTAMTDFVQTQVESGDYVVVYSSNNHHLQDMPVTYRNALNNFFQRLGISITQLNGISDDRAFIAFGRADDVTYGAELIIDSDGTSLIEFDPVIAAKAGIGNIESPLIGPATEWNTVKWEFSNVASANITVAVFGIDNNGDKVQIYNGNGPNNVLNINGLSAAQYPFIQLEAILVDDLNVVTPQLEYWEVEFDRAPEIALDVQEFFVFHSDTLQEGDEVQLQVALTNVETANMDSMLVQYSIIDRNNQTNTLHNSETVSIPSGQTIITSFSYSTDTFWGNNILMVELNPSGVNYKTEKMAFNNVLFIPFYVIRDAINPYMELTIDGRHVFNNELVSSKPEIVINITDDNPYLPLNDTASFEIVLKYPDASGEPAIEKPQSFASEFVHFYPPSQDDTEDGKNTARIELFPNLYDDGFYELEVRAKDRSGNVFAENQFTKRFKVINQSMISEVVNYPNPFSTSTRFAFTLTGSKIPEYFKIQIMTISGKVVREINQAELGTIGIGQNMSDFAWDGTDEFGNQLANGIYLYRVVTKIDSENIDHYDTSLDGFFKNGIGKMYLMR